MLRKTNKSRQACVRIAHRKSVGERNRRDGVCRFSECEMLELQLSYAMPGKNTRLLACKLLKKFGSASAVMNASCQELMREGVPWSVAFLIELFGDALVFVKAQSDRKCVFSDYKRMALYTRFAMRNVWAEQVCAMLLDENGGYLEQVRIGSGGEKGCDFDFASLVNRCNETGAQKAVVVHNHPAGKTVSTEDFIVTDLIKDVLDSVKVELLEHFIISGAVVDGIVQTEKEYRAKFEVLCAKEDE